jgi:thioredoxin-like negative regulator of GroEL
LGAALLLLVCAVIWISAPQRASEVHGAATLEAGHEALERGREQLRKGDVKGALKALRTAEAQLGDSPAVQRWLGEALLRAGQRERGIALLRRYLAGPMEPPDRAGVEALLAAPSAPSDPSSGARSDPP